MDNQKNDRYYILCTGYYAAKDFKILGMRNDKLLRWAYFSAVIEMTREYNDNHSYEPFVYKDPKKENNYLNNSFIQSFNDEIDRK